MTNFTFFTNIIALCQNKNFIDTSLRQLFIYYYSGDISYTPFSFGSKRNQADLSSVHISYTPFSSINKS